jgi:ornithine cyclodeaminase
MRTLLITRGQVEALLDPAAIADPLRRGFIEYSREKRSRGLRVRSDLPSPGTATVLFPGIVAGMPVYTVKVHSKFPEQRPAIRGVLCLHDLEKGDLLAVMDSTHLTAVRTGFTGALAADVLASPGADTIAVLGAGVQGRRQLMSLASFRPIRRVTVYDTADGVAEQFSTEMQHQLGVAVEPVSSPESAVRGAGIVLIATWAREPLLQPGMLSQGAHVTTLGADEPGKVEVSREVICSASFFCDDSDLAVEMGALASTGLTRDQVAAELGEVLAGRHPGRTSADEVTIYGGVGLAFQDAVCAWQVYQAAVQNGVGQAIDFLA